MNNNIINRDFLLNKPMIDINKENFNSIRNNILYELEKKYKSSLDDKFLESAFFDSDQKFIFSVIFSSVIFLLLECYSCYAASDVFLCILSLFCFPFYFLIIYFVSSLGIKKQKEMPSCYHNLNMEYLLPLSSEDIKILINNNSLLKKYIVENKDKVYNQYKIDYFLNRNEEYRNMFNKLGLSLDDVLDNAYDNEFEIFKIKDSIREEQNKIKDINIVTSLNNYKVTYKIKNGPTKEVIFKHTNEDIETFKRYILSLTHQNYNREFDILKIELV